jgi:hypothetical protein
MLIPRFSLRRLLLLNVGFALVFLLGRFALAGSAWAVGLMMGVVATAALMMIFGFWFLAAYSISFAYWFRRTPPTESPFATDKLPPQVIPPRYSDD